MAETKVKPESLEERSRKPRSGLSINDTIAAVANLPVGGTTARGGTAAGVTASVPGQEEISARAYQRWHQRGCPDGSPEVDWREAEEELKTAR